MLEGINTAYLQRSTLGDNKKAVHRKLVYVTGSESAVYLQEAAEDEAKAAGTDGNKNGAGVPAGNTNYNLPGNNEQQLLLTIVANPNNLQCGLLAQGNGLNNLAGSVKRLEKSLNHLVRQVNTNPARMMQQEVQHINPVANLE